MAKVNLTPGRISSFTCTAGQSFLWDSTAPGLGVRATPGGTKAFILQSRFAGKAIRITIGDVGAITLSDARNEARRLMLLIEQGIDPREKKRKDVAEQEAARTAREEEEALKQARGALVADIWEEYLAARAPKWGERHLKDHRKLSQDGSVERRKGGGLRKPGPLHALLCLHLNDLTPVALEQWIEKEAAERPTQSRLALRLLQSFLNWCNEHPLYQSAVNPGVITRESERGLAAKAGKDRLFDERAARRVVCWRSPDTKPGHCCLPSSAAVDWRTKARACRLAMGRC
jgi:Methionine synthase I, cobalamin-binding domain